MGINIQPPKHMKCFYGSYVNKKTLLLLFVFSSSFLFLRGLFSNSGTRFIFLSCRKQCCLFEFPSLAVILKHSFHFINSMPYSRNDPLHRFVSALMTSVLKEIPFTSLTQNTLYLSLSSPRLLLQILSPTYFDQSFHHDAGERPRFFPS